MCLYSCLQVGTFVSSTSHGLISCYQSLWQVVHMHSGSYTIRCRRLARKVSPATTNSECQCSSQYILQLRPLQICHGEVRCRRKYQQGSHWPIYLLCLDCQVQNARHAPGRLPDLHSSMGCRIEHLPPPSMKRVLQFFLHAFLTDFSEFYLPLCSTSIGTQLRN